MEQTSFYLFCAPLIFFSQANERLVGWLVYFRNDDAHTSPLCNVALRDRYRKDPFFKN